MERPRTIYYLLFNAKKEGKNEMYGEKKRTDTQTSQTLYILIKKSYFYVRVGVMNTNSSKIQIHKRQYVVGR